MKKQNIIIELDNVGKHYEMGEEMNFVKWPKIPRLENEVFYISEKIDGTNACIAIETTTGEIDPQAVASIDFNGTDLGVVNIYAQSRTRFITPESDNYGFAKWVQTNAEQLITDLGEGHHFGEWWGQGIQRGYNLTEKRFSLFNPTKESSICHHVPFLMSGSDLENMVADATSKLLCSGSLASPGYMRPEGLVIYGERSHAYWKVILDK